MDMKKHLLKKQIIPILKAVEAGLLVKELR